MLGSGEVSTNAEVVYVLAGEGAEKEALMARAKAEGIANVRFLSNQPKSTMPALLNLAYATIIPLRRLELFKSALPSKMFESMAVGRPIVAALWGEAATLIDQAECGIVVEHEDAGAAHQAVGKLAADPALARLPGASGPGYAIRNFERKDIAEQFIQLLRVVASVGAPTAAKG